MCSIMLFLPKNTGSSRWADKPAKPWKSRNAAWISLPGTLQPTSSPPVRQEWKVGIVHCSSAWLQSRAASFRKLRRTPFKGHLLFVFAVNYPSYIFLFYWLLDRFSNLGSVLLKTFGDMFIFLKCLWNRNATSWGMCVPNGIRMIPQC